MRFFDSLLERPVPLAGLFAVLLAVAEIAFDWITRVQLDGSALYGLPLVLAAVARSRRLLWGLAAVLIAMTFAAYSTQIGPDTFSLDEPYFVNRVLSAVSLVLTAALCQVIVLAGDKLGTQRRSLVEQNRELDELRRAAEDASSRKTQLLASVSHDIRTPLTSIDLIADLMLHKSANATLAAELPDLVQRLRRNTRSLADLVTALVDISALDSGRVSVTRSEFSINDLLREEQQRLLPLAQTKGLRLAVEFPPQPVWLRTDRVKLMRVLSNLVVNAIKFTAAGEVVLSAAPLAEKGLLIQVRDTGAGMTPGSLRLIFEEYGQLGDPLRDGNKGWGLGLAICRRLVGVLGGEISVQSEPGRGTVFSVLLPPACLADDPVP
jgi:signal transduction histidine kinase